MTIALIRSLLRRSAGVDLIAILAVAGAFLLGEYLAAAVIALMLGTGRALRRTRRVAPSASCHRC
jgi:cation transport ATPase